MEYDSIAKAYMNLAEMAYDKGNPIFGVNTPHFSDGIRNSFRNKVREASATKIDSGDGHETVTNGFEYFTKRKGTDSIDRISIFKHLDAKDNLPEHIEQEAVIKDQSVNFPKTLNHDIMDHAIKLHNLPLKSSKEQYTPGQRIWDGYVRKHVDQGLYHVYYHDGENFTPTNKNNIDAHLKSYIKSDEVEGHKHHMVISPFPLK